MIFIINYTDQSSTLLSAATWSEASAYAEGTGKDISFINQPNYATLVLNSPLSNNFYQLTLKNNTTGASTNYFVFEEDFQSLNSWVELQTNTEVTQLHNQQRNYVSL
jgi:hypothetical protein